MYPHGASPYGLLDIGGNLWERCLNEYNNPDRIHVEGDADRVVRGGSFFLATDVSVLRRDGWNHRTRFNGFRVVAVFVAPVS